MAQVVYTRIDRIEDLPCATWHPGVQDSYEETKRLAGFAIDRITLIGRQAKDGSVQLAYVKTGRSAWHTVGAWHLTLARFFSAMIEKAPPGRYLRPFFERIDDAGAANAARQLIGVDVGINTPYVRSGEAHMALLRLCASVSALACIPDGDWMFVPIRATVYGVTE